jgi:hypothetical protein
MHISLAKVYLGSKDEWLRPYLINKVFFIVIKPDLRIDPAKGRVSGHMGWTGLTRAN